MYNSSASGVRACRGFHLDRRPGVRLRPLRKRRQARSRATSASSTATPSSSARRASGSRASTPRRRRRPAGASGSAVWPCGTAATEALVKLIGSKPVSCEPRGLDKYGRTLAVCFVDGHDINAQMVRQGYAWAFVRYSHELREGGGGGARRGPRHLAGRGHAGLGVPRPALGRRRAAGARTAAPSRATSPSTAGSITCPGAPGTRRSGSSREKGKRWFCTEAEAHGGGLAAGAGALGWGWAPTLRPTLLGLILGLLPKAAAHGTVDD